MKIDWWNPKYNIGLGTKLTIRKDLSTQKQYDGVCVVKEMLDQVGLPVTITSFYYDKITWPCFFCIREDGEMFTWTTGMTEEFKDNCEEKDNLYDYENDDEDDDDLSLL